MTTTDDSAYLAGKLLLAMPSMADPRFHRAVIFVCAHDANGAMGLVINHPLPHVDFKNLLEQLNIGDAAISPLPDLPVLGGGPVEQARGFLLHSDDYAQKDTVQIKGGYAVTGTIDALRAIATGNGPGERLFMLGYAGWGAGQLDKELQDNGWLVLDPAHDLLFTTDAEDKWDVAMRRIGIDPAMLSGEMGRA